MLAMALGAPGIFLVAFLDSSILSLPEIADLLVIWMVTNNKSRLVLYVVSATLGSLLGLPAAVLASAGRAARRSSTSGSGPPTSSGRSTRSGGTASWPSSSRRSCRRRRPSRSSCCWPASPTSASRDSATAILIGRGLRYTVEGLLALWYGERAMAFIRENGSTVAIALVAAHRDRLRRLPASRSRPRLDKLQ